MLLLKKIEELTLYVIDQNTKIEALAQKNEHLEAEVNKLKGKLMLTMTRQSMKKNTLVLTIILTLTAVSVKAQDLSNNLYFSGDVGDKLSLHQNRFGSTSMYGFGVESSTLYYKTYGIHRWYVSKNADNGNSSILQLNNSGLKLQYGDFQIERGGEINFSLNGELRAGIKSTNTSPYNELQFFTGAYEPAMRIDANGNVGIGITDPSSKLEVDGAMKSSGKLSLISNSSALGDIISLYGDRLGNTNMYGFGIETNGGTLYTKAVSGHNWYINSNATNGTTAMMKLTSGELTIDGKVRSEEVKVEVVNPPDYVFEDEYQLRTLAATKSYIEEHKHLPEVPSAKEMEANGVEVGKMNMLLLKKIEELTLHQIDLMEKLEKLISENRKQAEQIKALQTKM